MELELTIGFLTGGMAVVVVIILKYYQKSRCHVDLELAQN